MKTANTINVSRSGRYLIARFLQKKTTYASRHDVRVFVNIAVLQTLYDYRPSLTRRQRATLTRLETAAGETPTPPATTQKERQMNLFAGIGERHP